MRDGRPHRPAGAQTDDPAGGNELGRCGCGCLAGNGSVGHGGSFARRSEARRLPATYLVPTAVASNARVFRFGRIPRTGTATLLFTCLFAVQAAFLTIAPILPELSREFGVSTAAGGQLRSVSGLAGLAAALVTIAFRRKIGVRRLLTWGLTALATGALLSAAAPSFAALAAAQVPVGLGLAFVLAGGLAAAAEWSAPEDRPRVLAWALLGQPGAWVAGMPIIGLVADLDWRLAFAIPFTAAATALVAVRRRANGTAAEAKAAERGSGTSIWRRPDVVGWAVGELMAFTAWSGVLVYIGALLIESYGLATRTTGLLLAAAAAAYFPASFVTQRFIAHHARTVLISLGLTAAAGTAVLGTITPSAPFSTALFAVIVAAVGGRTLAASAFGLQAAPDDRVAISAIRAAMTQLGYFGGAALGGVALAAGGYPALTHALAVAFVLAVTPHFALVIAASRRRPAPVPA
jgi:predicted MFS family arabinose efflux permease